MIISRFFAIVTLFVCLVICVFGAAEGKQLVSGTCIAVKDGDSAVVRLNGRRKIEIRLWGIDAPEKGQDVSEQSKKYLSKLILNRPVHVDVVNIDTYGRNVSRMYVGNTFVNQEMVRRGLAWHYKYFAPTASQLAKAESLAKKEKRGIWAYRNPIAPWDWRRMKKQSAGNGNRQQPKTEENSKFISPSRVKRLLPISVPFF